MASTGVLTWFNVNNLLNVNKKKQTNHQRKKIFNVQIMNKPSNATDNNSGVGDNFHFPPHTAMIPLFFGDVIT